MRGRRVTEQDIEEIIGLRKKGHSLPEIRRITGRGNSTIFPLIRDVVVEEPYRAILKAKQGGSKVRAEKKWKHAIVSAHQKIGTISARDKLFIVAALYWGEGNKNELNLINGDPALISAFISCLSGLGVCPDDLRVSVRMYADMERNDVLRFWSRITAVPAADFRAVEVIEGKKKGKLKYGMCRVRVRKSEAIFKEVMSMIECIKFQLHCPRSTMDSAAAS